MREKAQKAIKEIEDNMMQKFNSPEKAEEVETEESAAEEQYHDKMVSCQFCSPETPNDRPGHPMFHELRREMGRIHDAKNTDYSQGGHLGNFMECESLGVPAWKGCLIRLQDKYTRIVNLATREAQVKDESIEDTLLDLANYALIVIVLRREAKNGTS